ncbi:BgTH12-06995 [Blumeria graminis f. sp. triticale]|uniref:Dolichyl-diphosphooligosaccharide--protein glycosyltransferase subunit 4 n=3 Tax=Blumeria graminis TaxID=34373 RepID=A0A061HCJ6_BLUGR|nr:hypothetical protein BGT96224_1062 [Blumeria graminis f. sp. tritici 96224]CAD6506063.1 BgTH12-06995 [Blumeria graminis f. sp. triticale]VDB94720.1 Bgt-1062 [Blumeria graminis f. sp. tritici]
MISDSDLYRLAIFLGSAAMLLIILYHFLEVNAEKESMQKEKPTLTSKNLDETVTKKPQNKVNGNIKA